MKVKYFAWVRERVGKDGENASSRRPPFVPSTT